MRIRLTLGALSLGAILAMSGCGSSSSSDPVVTDLKGRAAINASTTAQAQIDKVADDVIKAGYATLGANATIMKDLLNSFGSDVDAGQVTAARTAWKSARAPWEASEAYIVATSPSVGNATDGNTDSWPVKSAGEIAQGLTAWDGDTLTIQNADGEIKGFHTIEFYLFGNGTAVESAADAATRLNAFTNAQGKYLRALGAAFEHDMTGLTDIWTAGAEDATGIAAFKGLSKADAASALIQGCVDIATEVGDGKINDPMNGGVPNKTKVESQFSWNSSADFYNNIHSIEKVWKNGLKGLATTAGATTAKTGAVDGALATALSAIVSISDLTRATVIDGTAVISSANAFRNKLDTDYTSIENAQTKVKALTAALEAVQSDMN